METNRMRGRYIVTFAFIIAITCLCGCQRKPASPEVLSDNKIVRVKKFWRVDNNERLGNTLSFNQREGYYAVIELEPLTDRPDEIDGEKVTDPRLWLCVAICYPEDQTRKSKQAVRFPVEPLFYPASAEQGLFPLASKGPQTNSPNFKGPLRLHLSSQPPDSRKVIKKLEQSGVRVVGGVSGNSQPGEDKVPVLKHKFEKGIIPYWLFLGDTHATPGEYTLEILTYPFFAGLKPGAPSPFGSPVIIYKGTVKIKG